MPLVTDSPRQQKSLSFDEFLSHYSSDYRYELIDGEVFDLEPTGQHEEVVDFITTKVCVQIAKAGLFWFVLQQGLLRPSNTGMTAFRPGVAVVDRVDGEYKIQLFRGDRPIISAIFPQLNLTAEQVLSAGG